MKILVLGGTGFIGSHIVSALIERGHQVRVMTRDSHLPDEMSRKVEHVRGNFTNSLELATALTNIEAVVHSVTATVPGTAELDQQGDVKNNLLPMIKLLDLMAKMEIKKLLYLSSGGTVYGIPSSIPTPEDSPLNPINSYGIVKVACENYIRMYARNHAIETKIIRASNPFGPRQINNRAQGFISAAMQNIRRSDPVVIWGDGSVIRDYIYVADLARLCADCLESRICGTFNAGSGEGISLKHLLDQIKEVVGHDFEVKYSEGRSIDVPVSILDTSKSRRELLYTPRFSLLEGLGATWNWISQHN